MKRIRGFGYVGDEDLDEEVDEVDLEHGFASSQVSRDFRETKVYTCPRCKHALFEADVTLHGVIFLKCRRCRRDVAVETAPMVLPIGFVNPLRKEKK